MSYFHAPYPCDRTRWRNRGLDTSFGDQTPTARI